MLPPKFSHSLKDLTSFLGIFEVSEEDINHQRDAKSETSSNLSHITQGMFKAKNQNELEVVHERHGTDSEETENQSEDEREHHTRQIGKIIKQSAQDYIKPQVNAE